MRFLNQLGFASIAVLTFVACGGRVPPEVQFKTDHYVGAWVEEADLKANIEANDGGAGTIRVLNILPTLEVLEEVRIPGQANPPDAVVVGRLFANVNKSGELNYNVAQMKEVKVGRRTDEDITRLSSRPLKFVVSIDRKSAIMTLTETVAGVKKESVTTLVKIDLEQRKKLKLHESPKRAGAPAPTAKPPQLPDPRTTTMRTK